jgi:hypothetical protein
MISLAEMAEIVGLLLLSWGIGVATGSKAQLVAEFFKQST